MTLEASKVGLLTINQCFPSPKLCPRISLVEGVQFTVMEEEINPKLFISDSLESEIFYYIVCETDRSIVAVTDS